MDANPAPHPLADSRQRWFVVGLLLFFVLLSVQYSFKVLDSDRDNRSAILRWRDQILAIEDGTNIYDRHNYPNPPIMVLLLKPLVELPPLLGSLGWFYLKVAMALLCLYCTFRMIETPARPFPAWGKALAVLLSLRPIMGDLSHGNVNIFILFLVVASLYAFRHGRDLACGLLLALATACKVTPALFVPYLVWKRAWGTLAGCALGLALFFWVVPGLFLGMGRNAELLHTWYERMIVPYVFEGEVTSEHHNQSLPGLVYRLTTQSPSFSTFVNDRYTPLEYHNVLALEPAVARGLVKGAMLVFAVLIVWTCRTPTAPRSGWRLAAEFSLIVLGMLMFSERTWKHHCVTLLLPFSVLAYYLSACRPGPALRGYLIGTLVVVVLLMSTTSTGLVASLERPAKLAQAYGAYVWAYAFLMAALMVQLRRGEQTWADQASTSETTCASGTSGTGRPVRSVRVVSGSMPSR
jgi:hypothetical protein